MNTNKKIAWVTGASRGIGAGIAQTLIDSGHFVVGTATSEAGARAITQRLGTCGMGVVMDVVDVPHLHTVLTKTTEQVGPISILVNNAGVTRDNLLLRMKPDDWDIILQTNLSSVFHLTRFCMKAMMKARWGRIINISSVVAEMGNAGQTNYAAAKAGVEGFTRSLAKEIASRGITVNAIAPGFIATDMTQGEGGLTPDQQAALLQQIPMGRMGRVEDIAHACVFLSSEAAGYITGQTLHINGGMYMQ